MSKAKKKTKPVKKAGRPKRTGKYGVPTMVMRIPAALEDAVHAFILKRMKLIRKQQENKQ